MEMLTAISIGCNTSTLAKVERIVKGGVREEEGTHMKYQHIDSIVDQSG